MPAVPSWSLGFAEPMTVRSIVTTETCARDALYETYSPCLTTNPDLDRTLVSFQANKREPFYRWFRYKEAFSTSLVNYCLSRLTTREGVLLDPFTGIGTSLFAASDLGWNAVGIELLPVGFYAITARISARDANLHKFSTELAQFQKVSFGRYYDPDYVFGHIPITSGAFPPATERDMAAYLGYCDKEIADTQIRHLFRFACFSSLEEISYTRKDGQYLRWDYRSLRRRGKTRFDKGRIPAFSEAICRKLQRMKEDLVAMRSQKELFGHKRGAIDIRKGSCLESLPLMRSRSVNFVVTSPPYCNRYDYTRTYALELAFLNLDAQTVKNLRQRLLSCTVENKEKTARLRQMYHQLGQMRRFETATTVFESAKALHEALNILDRYKQAGKLNNSKGLR